MTAATTPPLHILRGILRLIKQSSPSKSPTPTSSSSSSSTSSSSSASPVVAATAKETIADSAKTSQSSSAFSSSNSIQTPPSSSSSISLHAHIISQYRKSQFLLPPQSTQQRKIAYDYYILKQDLIERARLHKLDMGADEKLSPRELTRRSAARAGLQLPEEVG